jgi:hypothetical protein
LPGAGAVVMRAALWASTLPCEKLDNLLQNQCCSLQHLSASLKTGRRKDMLNSLLILHLSTLMAQFIGSILTLLNDAAIPAQCE